MTFAVLMVVLTLSNGGQLSAAFVNTPTLADCEKRAAVVRGILDKGNVKITQIICRSSNIQFEPFAHGAEDDVKRHAYIVSFDDRSATIEPVASCDARSMTGEGRYCATSSQKPLPQSQ